MKKLLSVIAVLCAFGAAAQNVSTYAGVQYTGRGQYLSTANNTLTTEKFSAPQGISIDTNGRFYISDEHNIIVLDGSASRIRAGYLGNPDDAGAAGDLDGTGVVSRFSWPEGLVVDRRNNNVFIVDNGNNTIRKMDKFSTVANGQPVSSFCGMKSINGGYVNGTATTSRFDMPKDIVITSTGVIYVSDMNNNCIRKVSSGGATTIAGKYWKAGYANGNDTNATFDAPCGLFLENDNSLLVADRNNKAIRRINLTTGAVTTVIKDNGLDAPTDVCVAKGAIYVNDGTCIRLVSGGTTTVFAGNATTAGYVNASGASARFEELAYMVYDAKSDCLFVTDKGNNVVRKVTTTAPPNVDFWASSTNVTVGQTVVIHSNCTNAPTSYSWSVSPGSYTLLNGSTLSDSVITLKFNATGGYTVGLTASNGAGPNSLNKNNYITVSSFPTNPPVADFTADKTNVATGVTVTFTDLSTNSPNAWEWTITPGTHSYVGGTSNTSQFPKVQFSAAGTYNVSLKATNTNGNNTKVKNSYITVTGGGTGISGISKKTISLWPNPAAEIINLNSSEAGTVQIFDAAGKMMSTWKVESGNTQLPLRNLAPGNYMIRLSNDRGSISGQFMKN